MAKKEQILIDEIITIDTDLFKKLDKKIREDKAIDKDEVHLWETVSLLPSKYCRDLEEYIKTVCKNRTTV